MFWLHISLLCCSILLVTSGGVLGLQGILQYVNKQLNLAQNRQRLLEHQTKLDVSALERTTHPIAQQFKVHWVLFSRTRACVYVYVHIVKYMATKYGTTAKDRVCQ